MTTTKQPTKATKQGWLEPINFDLIQCNNLDL
jgi:hypothetical protein